MLSSVLCYRWREAESCHSKGYHERPANIHIWWGHLLVRHNYWTGEPTVAVDKLDSKCTLCRSSQYLFRWNTTGSGLIILDDFCGGIIPVKLEISVQTDRFADFSTKCDSQYIVVVFRSFCPSSVYIHIPDSYIYRLLILVFILLSFVYLVVWMAR